MSTNEKSELIFENYTSGFTPEEKTELENSMHYMVKELSFPCAVTYGRNEWIEEHLKKMGYTHLAYSGLDTNSRIRQLRGGGLTFNIL